MEAKPRVVFDTNALVSRLLLPASIPGRAVRHAADQGVVLASEATLLELADVLARPKFDPYVTVTERQEFVRRFARIALVVEIIRVVKACRDPNDDKFLELALDGEANVIVTGDRDLLALHPFETIPILSPADYLARAADRSG